MSFTFNFNATGSEYIYKISSNIILHLYRTTHAVAILEFTDETSNKINIPTEIIIYTKDYQTNQNVILKPTNNMYALCWTDDYMIKYNGNIILNIKNNRTWDITT